MAEDGVIEAIETKNNHFVVGVQFHPEEIVENNQGMKYLFTAFVNAAKEYYYSKNSRQK